MEVRIVLISVSPAVNEGSFVDKVLGSTPETDLKVSAKIKATRAAGDLILVSILSQKRRIRIHHRFT
jgi:hypothetical protein